MKITTVILALLPILGLVSAQECFDTGLVDCGNCRSGAERFHCKATCNTCDSICKSSGREGNNACFLGCGGQCCDYRPTHVCRRWESSGRCRRNNNRNYDWYAMMCAKTCNACDDEPATTTTSSSPSASTTSTPTTSASTSTPTQTQSIAFMGPDGECENIRKDWFQLSRTEKTTYVGALQALIEQGRYQEINAYHVATSRHRSSYDSQMHQDVYLFHWHRAFLFEFEMQLRSAGDEFQCVSLPYWDWSKALSDLQDEGGDISDFHRTPMLRQEMRDCGNGMICTPYGNIGPIPTYDGDQFYHNQRVFRQNFEDSDQFMNRIQTDDTLDEFMITVVRGHNSVHNYIGGTMSTMESPTSPLFMLHHANVDKLWAEYEKCRGDSYLQEERRRENIDLPGLHSSKRVSSLQRLGRLTRAWTAMDTIDHTTIGGRGYSYQENWEDWDDSSSGNQSREDVCQEFNTDRRRGLHKHKHKRTHKHKQKHKNQIK
eukprot:Pgem_evm1s16658